MLAAELRDGQLEGAALAELRHAAASPAPQRAHLLGRVDLRQRLLVDVAEVQARAVVVVVAGAERDAPVREHLAGAERDPALLDLLLGRVAPLRLEGQLAGHVEHAPVRVALQDAAHRHLARRRPQAVEALEPAARVVAGAVLEEPEVEPQRAAVAAQDPVERGAERVVVIALRHRPVLLGVEPVDRDRDLVEVVEHVVERRVVVAAGHLAVHRDDLAGDARVLLGQPQAIDQHRIHQNVADDRGEAEHAAAERRVVSQHLLEGRHRHLALRAGLDPIRADHAIVVADVDGLDGERERARLALEAQGRAEIRVIELGRAGEDGALRVGFAPPGRVLERDVERRRPAGRSRLDPAGVPDPEREDQPMGARRRRGDDASRERRAFAGVDALREGFAAFGDDRTGGVGPAPGERHRARALAAQWPARRVLELDAARVAIAARADALEVVDAQLAGERSGGAGPRRGGPAARRVRARARRASAPELVADHLEVAVSVALIRLDVVALRPLVPGLEEEDAALGRLGCHARDGLAQVTSEVLRRGLVQDHGIHPHAR